MGAQAVRLSNVDIDKALENKDFEVLFQPIFDLGNGALARMESFVRWRHPSLGMLPPGAFISFFESQGRMSELTRYVLAASLSAYTEWRGPSAPGFSINLAMSDLSDEAFSSHFEKLLRDFNFPADLITLECPMPAVDVDLDVASAQFSRLGATGARLAIEVRGRANDLLRNIDPFPFDEIKTGGSSILRFARTVRGPGLTAISDLLDIANQANAVITAVGVEDQASLSALRGLGFTAAQGNHLSKVGSIDDFLPGRVNEVRELLGLKALSKDNLAALFRTDGAISEATDLETLQTVEQQSADEMIERLNERVSKQTPAESKATVKDSTVVKEGTVTDEAKLDEQQQEQIKQTQEAERKAKARERAKTLALAKRAKAREDLKAVAIARAKAKTAENGVNADQEAPAGQTEGTTEQPKAVNPQPHELQKRINQEFATMASSDTDKMLDTGTQAKPDGENSDISPKGNAAAPITSNREQNATADMNSGKKLSVPEKLAAAAQAAVEANKVAAAADAAAEKELAQNVASKVAPQTSNQQASNKIGVSIKNVRTYFQPGMSVGGPAFNQRMETTASKAAELNRSANTQAPSVAEKKPTVPERIVLAESTSATKSPATIETPSTTEKVQATEEPVTASEALPDEVAPQKTVRKSFLKRTVLPYPNHFWPRSWRRSYRRWTAQRVAG